MRHEYLYQWTLKFKDPRQETKYCDLREDMFRSNVICVYIIWLFILACQLTIEPHCQSMIINLSLSTAILTLGVAIVMAEEFNCCIHYLKAASAFLVNQRNYRTFFICLVVTIMSVSSAVALFSCPEQKDIVRDYRMLPFITNVETMKQYMVSQGNQTEI